MKRICKNCLNWEPRKNFLNGYGICEVIDGCGKEDTCDILLDDVYEGQYLWTGENFGCVKFVKKPD